MTERTSTPAVLPVTPSTVPPGLTDACGWLVWRYAWRTSADGGKWAKVPLTVTGGAARTNDPRTHAAFADAVDAYQRSRSTASPLSGIGLVLPPPEVDAPALVAVDVDGGIDPDTGALSPAVAEILAPLRGHAFVEVSPSGTGVHMFAYGPLPPRHRWEEVPGVKAVEAWGGGGGARYVTVTGHPLPGWEGAPDPSPASVAAVAAVWAALEATAPARQASTPRPPVAPPARAPLPLRGGVDLTAAAGDPRLEGILRRAHGVRGFTQLWRGDLSAVAGNRSRADNRACYCLRLVGAEAGDVDALIRRSALYREKWDSARGESTYGAVTIANAFAAATPLPDRPYSAPTLYVGAPSPTLPASTPPAPRQSPYDPRSGAIVDETAPHPAEVMLSRIRDVLAVPADALSAVDKCVAIATALAIDETDAARIRAHAEAVGVDVDALPALTVDALRRAPRAVTRDAIGRTAGVSADTAGSAVRRLAERGIVTARTRSERWATVDASTGEIREGWTKRLEVAPAIDETGEAVDVLTAAARYRPSTPRRHGGRRLPATGCALHPRADAICRDCLVAILPPGALPRIDREIHRLHVDAAAEAIAAEAEATIVDAVPTADGWAVEPVEAIVDTMLTPDGWAVEATIPADASPYKWAAEPSTPDTVKLTVSEVDLVDAARDEGDGGNVAPPAAYCDTGNLTVYRGHRGGAYPDTVKLTVSQYDPPPATVSPTSTAPSPVDGDPDAAYLARTRSPLADAPRLDTAALFAHTAPPPSPEPPPPSPRGRAEARSSTPVARQAELFGGGL